LVWVGRGLRHCHLGLAAAGCGTTCLNIPANLPDDFVDLELFQSYKQVNYKTHDDLIRNRVAPGKDAEAALCHDYNAHWRFRDRATIVVGESEHSEYVRVFLCRVQWMLSRDAALCGVLATD
jgi:hypothetical protein